MWSRRIRSVILWSHKDLKVTIVGRYALAKRQQGVKSEYHNWHFRVSYQEYSGGTILFSSAWPMDWIGFCLYKLFCYTYLTLQ